MRFGVMVLLLSSPLFAQDTVQIMVQQQAAQAANDQVTMEAARQASQDAQRQMETAARANQQAMQDAALANRSAQQPATGAPFRVTHAPRFSPKPGTFKGVTPYVTITCFRRARSSSNPGCDKGRGNLLHYGWLHAHAPVTTLHRAHCGFGNNGPQGDRHRTLFRSESHRPG
jgi:hypothetical protein